MNYPVTLVNHSKWFFWKLLLPVLFAVSELFFRFWPESLMRKKWCQPPTARACAVGIFTHEFSTRKYGQAGDLWASHPIIVSFRDHKKCWQTFDRKLYLSAAAARLTGPCVVRKDISEKPWISLVVLSVLTYRYGYSRRIVWAFTDILVKLYVLAWIFTTMDIHKNTDTHKNYPL